MYIVNTECEHNHQLSKNTIASKDFPSANELILTCWVKSFCLYHQFTPDHLLVKFTDNKLPFHAHTALVHKNYSLSIKQSCKKKIIRRHVQEKDTSMKFPLRASCRCCNNETTTGTTAKRKHLEIVLRLLRNHIIKMKN